MGAFLLRLYPISNPIGPLNCWQPTPGTGHWAVKCAKAGGVGCDGGTNACSIYSRCERWKKRMSWLPGSDWEVRVMSAVCWSRPVVSTPCSSTYRKKWHSGLLRVDFFLCAAIKSGQSGTSSVWCSNIPHKEWDADWGQGRVSKTSLAAHKETNGEREEEINLWLLWRLFCLHVTFSVVDTIRNIWSLDQMFRCQQRV